MRVSLSPSTTTNRIHDWLQSIGVTWLTPRSELVAKYGVSQHPAYEWPVIQLNDATQGLSELTSPIWARAWGDECPIYPATEWSAETSLGDDSHLNIERTAAEIAATLGDAAIYPVNNTLSCTWMDGSARVQLMAWPPEMQRHYLGPNSAHERDPRLVTACHVTIHTGWLPNPSEKELEWLQTFQPLFDLDKARSSSFRLEPPPESYLPVIRARTSDFQTQGKLGLSADHAAIILETRRLFLIPKHNSPKLELQRILPARGPGGSQIDLTFDVASATRKGEMLFHHSDIDGLNTVAQTVSDALGVELSIRPEAYDD